MEIESAARRFLLQADGVRGYVGDSIWKYRLEESLEGTGGMAVVVVRSTGWATPQPLNTQEYPRLLIDVVADPTRDSRGEIQRLDAEDRAYAVARVIDPLFHGKRGFWMGGMGNNRGLFVNSVQRGAEPVLITGADNHPPEAGDTVKVRTEYHFDVVH